MEDADLEYSFEVAEDFEGGTAAGFIGLLLFCGIGAIVLVSKYRELMR